MTEQTLHEVPEPVWLLADVTLIALYLVLLIDALRTASW